MKKMLWVSRSHHLNIPNIILPANSRLTFTVQLDVDYAFCSLEGRWRCIIRLDVLLLFVCFVLHGRSKADGYKLWLHVNLSDFSSTITLCLAKAAVTQHWKDQHCEVAWTDISAPNPAGSEVLYISWETCMGEVMRSIGNSTAQTQS